MSSIFATMLIVHVVSGLIGVTATYMSLLTLLKKEVIREKFVFASFVAWLGYMVSWLAGGYYYWYYYGFVVKPVIKAGDYVWAHNVVMEAKEHIFFLLPVLSIVILFIAWSSTPTLNTDSRLKSAVVYLVSVTCVIAIVVALSGILISGGAR